MTVVVLYGFVLQQGVMALDAEVLKALFQVGFLGASVSAVAVIWLGVPGWPRDGIFVRVEPKTA
jgi:hypothetical protein